MFKLLNMVTYTKYPDFLIKRHANISDDSYEPFQNVYNFSNIFFFKILNSKFTSDDANRLLSTSSAI